MIDFEHLDVRAGFNLGELHLEWTQVPSPSSRGTAVADNFGA